MVSYAFPRRSQPELSCCPPRRRDHRQLDSRHILLPRPLPRAPGGHLRGSLGRLRRRATDRRDPLRRLQLPPLHSRDLPRGSSSIPSRPRGRQEGHEGHVATHAHHAERRKCLRAVDDPRTGGQHHSRVDPWCIVQPASVCRPLRVQAHALLGRKHRDAELLVTCPLLVQPRPPLTLNSATGLPFSSGPRGCIGAPAIVPDRVRRAR